MNPLILFFLSIVMFGSGLALSSKESTKNDEPIATTVTLLSFGFVCFILSLILFTLDSF